MVTKHIARDTTPGTMIDEPEVCFSDWRQWPLRERLTEEFDVPEEFGLLGIYLLATSEVCEGLPPKPTEKYLHPNVIYIGMSEHVTRRLDKHHKAVRRYREIFNDDKTTMLFYSDWLSPWSNSRFDASHTVAKRAYLHFVERKLLWEYARTFDRLPLLNRF